MSGLFEAEFCLRLVLTLGHFLWQGALIGLIGLAAGRVLRKRSIRLKYAVDLVALTAMPACAVVTFSLLRVDFDVRDDLERSSIDVAVVTDPVTQNPVGKELSSDRPESDNSATSEWNGNRADRSVTPAAVAPRASATDSTSVVTDVVVPAEGAPVQRTAEEPDESVTAVVTPAWNPVEGRPTASTVASFDWRRMAPWLTGLYVAGVVLMLLRLGRGLRGGRRLRRLSEPVTES